MVRNTRITLFIAVTIVILSYIVSKPTINNKFDLASLEKVCNMLKALNSEYQRNIGSYHCRLALSSAKAYDASKQSKLAFMTDKGLKDLKLYLLQICVCRSIMPCFQDSNWQKLMCKPRHDTFRLIKELRTIWHAFKISITPMLQVEKKRLIEAEAKLLKAFQTGVKSNRTILCHSACTNCGLGSRIDQINTCLMIAWRKGMHRITLSGSLEVFTKGSFFNSSALDDMDKDDRNKKVETHEYLSVHSRMGNRKDLLKSVPDEAPFEVGVSQVVSIGHDQYNVNISAILGQGSGHSVVLWGDQQAHNPVIHRLEVQAHTPHP